jgi:hypothetical protein
MCMAGLWRNNPETREGKYLVKRRDGTIPEWPYFVIGAKDPAAPATLRAYADAASRLGMDPRYVRDVRQLADTFAFWLESRGCGDPDAPRHREDDPAIIAEMEQGFGA